MQYVLRGTVIAASLFSLTGAAQASLSITNGDFEADAAQTSNVTDWFDTVTANAGNWWESTWAGPTVSPNGTSVLGLSYMFTSLNWAYQSIGTNSDGLSTLDLKFDMGSFTDASGNRELGVTFGLYKADGSFVPGDNTDVDGAAGITFLDSFTYQNVLAPGTMDTDVTGSLDLTGAGSTDELYLRVINVLGGTGEPWTAVDNISIVPVPEPASLVLMGLGGLMMLRRHRD